MHTTKHYIHKLGEEPKEATRELRRRRQCCATPKIAARYKPERHLELLHHGTIPLNQHTTIVDPPISVEHQKNTHIAVPIKPTYPGH